jgi:hypothetical protein
MSAAITSTGTATAMTDKPGRDANGLVGQGDTFLNLGLGNGDLGALAGVQTDAQYYQEVNQFIGIMAAAQGVQPRQAISRLVLMLNSMLQQPDVLA